MHHKNLLASAAIGLLSLAMLFLGASSLNGQDAYGGISGTVMDATGAVVPGAAVTVVNLGTNETRRATSGAAGEYRFVNLLPASYKLDVEANSFKRFEMQQVVVQVGNTVRIDATLQPGDTTETVTVTTQAPLLQTESGTVGNLVERQVVESMPLNGRNTMNLIGLAPGIVPLNNAAGSAAFNSGNRTNFGFWGGYQIAGAFTNESAQYIDGTSDNVFGGSLLAFVPSQDAVQEFKIESSVPSAEYGRFGGGVISMTTKSGANAFHGGLYEYVRNTILNAQNFFAASGAAKQPFHQNQYGAVIGGPIKRDKAFFFFSWESFALRQASPNSTNVPGDGTNGTKNMRAGVFADTIGGKARTITDPAGKSGHCWDPTANGGAGGTKITHDLIAHTYNIPSSCFDATAVVEMGYFPPPNSTANPTYNFVVAPVLGNNATQYNARVDYNLSDKQRIFGRYSRWTTKDIGQNEFANYGGFPTGYASPTNATYQIGLGDTYTINSTTIADVRISYTRMVATNSAPSLGFGKLSQFGPAYSALNGLLDRSTLPVPLFSGSDGIFGMTPASNIGGDYYHNYAVNGSVSKFVGAHSLKFGGEGVLREHAGIGHYHGSGFSSFSNTTTGDEVASFLLGEFTTDVAQTQLSVTAFNYAWGFYGTDTWKLTRNLTVNLGLRWELPGGIEEKKDRETVLLPNSVDPVTGKNGAIVLVNNSSSLYASRSMEPVRHSLFAPRLTFAQNLPGSFVVRGGYGIAYLPPDVPIALQAYANPINAAVTTTQNGAVPAYFLSSPFPDSAYPNDPTHQKILQPVGRSNSSFASTLAGQAISVPVPTTKFPYMGQWNVSVGKQWKGEWSTEISYAGSKGTHLPENVAYSLDQVPSGSVAALQTMENSLIAGGSTATAAANSTIAYGKTLEAYPYFQNLSDGAAYTGSSTYNALFLVGQKRFRSGGLINANYTWSKMLTDTDVPNANSTSGVGGTGYPQDYGNHKADKSLAAFDMTRRLVINYVLKLPFGKGQMYGSHVTGFADKLVSGWAVNGIANIQSGFPLVMQYNGNFLSKNLNSGTIRPNYVAGCQKKTSGNHFDKYSTNYWFNAACFTYPGDFSFGNEPRVDPALRAQGRTNFDLSLSKTTTIRESVNLQFTAESFNLFNHPLIPAPGTVMAGSFYNSINISNAYVAPRLVQLSLRLNF